MNHFKDTHKWMQRLVRIISEKEKIIDQLKRNNKQSSKSVDLDTANESSIVELQLREELNLVNGEVKALVKKMNLMESKILELTAGLKEQTVLNQQLSEQIQRNQQSEQILQNRIKALEEQLRLLRQQNGIIQALSLEKEILEIKASSLQQSISTLIKQNIELQSTVSKYQQEQCQIKRFISRISSLIKELTFSQVDRTGLSQITKQIKTTLAQQLVQIERQLEQCLQSTETDFLNDSIDGISVIMRNLEQNPSKAHSMAEYEDHLHFDNERGIKGLKESMKSVPSTMGYDNLKWESQHSKTNLQDDKCQV